ncbi:ImmA/IrrE family metallo-endopeptidase [Sinorhizobium meliloti]|uniref:ImmA/IrrE family metallo-endopeptidase n=1 Tax=Rhizobium meliloti TaxID=382 RepID=UPI003F5CF46A
MSKASVDALAASVAKNVGYDAGSDLYPIITKLGGSLVVTNLWEVSDATSGSIRIEQDGSFEIALAAHTGSDRDRFTIAHELGHYVLHYLLPNQNGKHTGPIEAKRYGSGRVEWEANWFAAGFLMPAEEFKKAWHDYGGSISALAEVFGVSTEAARVRCETLNLK